MIPTIAALNVTDRFSDLAPEDAIYETADGYLVKVKTLWDDTSIEDDPALARASLHGAEKFRVTGAIVGADGKALRRECGQHAVYNLGQTHTHHADRLENPTAGLELARLRCVAATVRAEKHYQMLHGGYAPGIARISEQAARKAAEAAAGGQTPES
jgi:hypothetical protein